MLLIPIDRDGAPRGYTGKLPEVASEGFSATSELYATAGFKEPWIGYLVLADGIPVGTWDTKQGRGADKLRLPTSHYGGNHESSEDFISQNCYLTAVLGMMGLFAAPMAKTAEISTVQPEKENFSSERLARFDAKIHGYVDQGSTAGVITLIARHGNIVHLDAYGKTEIGAGAPMKANSLFRMYSMTKPITSTALLMLYEEGRFQLDDRVF